MITVISTAWGNVTDACVGSVRRQERVEVDHLAINAAAQVPPRAQLENVVRLAASLPADRIVALLDGDDFLADPHALAMVEAAHSSGAWVTYGSFRYADGQPGFAAPHAPTDDVRRVPWRATHLKTIRAGLLQRLDPHLDLTDPDTGTWLKHARDQAVMLPCLEMAGHHRSVFIGHCLYVYSGSRFEHEATDEDREDEARCVRYVRSRPPRFRLAQL